MLPIQKKISKYNNSSRNGSSIQYIVIHWVGAVSTAKNNVDYFYGGNRNASAHYFVDNTSIWQSVDTARAAWHCGGGRQGPNGGTFLGKCTNSNSIGIEMCCVRNSSGKMYVSTQTIANTAGLVQYLMKKFNVPASRVIRHFDVTGKNCPGGFTTDATWAKLKAQLVGGTTTTPTTPPTSNDIALDKVWGKATTRKAQQVFKTPVDGIVSNQYDGNKKYLSACDSSSWQFKSSGFSAGSTLLKKIQEKLKSTKHYTGDIDGIFGQGSVKALQRFLASEKLYTGSIDGYMGPLTVYSWQKYLNKF